MSSKEFEIKQGDTGPALSTVLLDGDGVPLDLTSAISVGLTMRLAKHPRTLVLNNETVTFSPDESGEVEYAWGLTDTAVDGLYNIEWTVIWPGTVPVVMTIPSCGYDKVKVNPRA